MEVLNRTLVTDVDYAAVELYKGYPESLLKFAAGCCVIFMIIGIPGNLITIIALAKYKRVHNATAIFIMNLSCSDVLFGCLTPPLAASTFLNRSWIHGKLLCKLYPPARYVLTGVSIFTILAITVNRYIIVVYPRLYRKIYTKWKIALMLALIWICPIILMIPIWLGKWGRFDLDEKNGSCTIVSDKNSISSKQILFATSFLLPCIPIFYCYGRIYFLVRKATKKSHPKTENANPSTEDSSTIDTTSITVRVTGENSDNNVEKVYNIPMTVIKGPRMEGTATMETINETSDNTDNEMLEPPKLRRNMLKRSFALLKVTLPTRKDKRLGTMIVAIMTAFCLCHFPIIITKVLRWITPNAAVNITAHLLLYMSSCINPLVYVVMSNEYRRAYKNLFRCYNKASLLKNDNKF